MNEKEITKVVKNLKPGDLIHVTSKVLGRDIVFHQIVEKVEPISTGYLLVYRAGITPDISDGVYRDAYRDINPYRDLNMELNIWDIRVISHNNPLPQYKEDYV